MELNQTQNHFEELWDDTMGALKDCLGWIGFALVLLCWVPQTIKCLRNEEIRLSKAFLALTASGSVTLFLHALFTKDTPFMVLNAYAALNAAINWYFLSARSANAATARSDGLEKSPLRHAP